MRPDEEPRCHQCRAIAWINGVCSICGEEKPIFIDTTGETGRRAFAELGIHIPKYHQRPVSFVSLRKKPKEGK